MEALAVKACLDTHAVIWSLMDDPKLGKNARELIASSTRDDLIVSDITLLEVSMLLSKGRLQTRQEPVFLLGKIADSFRILPISPEIAALATSLALPQGDPFDRVIAATAVHHGIPLLSRDKALKRSKAVDILW
ncbi:type II toxin-antitoxin system VapC family toxin [Luteolibacter flavescens]|uniref:Type II toxin-antitoxin system VapC family toxin n=1 Tax=Luteolibacter flavescens TaxID=1859460 RepID=A0ABT3FLH5_9BACT|nr:type II toxin-antitoxin system VapC family toxin [Luteolibacter flavescens]MCW1884424.1 type II toxin-antitoxin system VapC family toxin [Luteolibacter flavescens]